MSENISHQNLEHPTDVFLSCDWGTSSFRLRLVDAKRGEKLAETTRDVGVKTIYLQSAKEGTDRANHFEAFLIRECELLLESQRMDVKKIPMMLSGMTSSTIGWIDLPYADVPFPLDGSGAIVEPRDLQCPSGTTIGCRLISGVATHDEMMRGEETELMGIFSLPPYHALSDHCLAVVPGTHSKHVFVKGGSIQSIQTYMTGELLDVLSRYSVLQATVDLSSVFDQKFQMTLESQKAAYGEGVLRAKQSGLLGSLFQARTRGVLHAAPAFDNIWYLMGLLIGDELLQIERHHSAELPVLIAAGSRFRELYQRAAQQYDMLDRFQFVSADDLENASWLGQKMLI